MMNVLWLGNDMALPLPNNKHGTGCCGGIFSYDWTTYFSLGFLKACNINGSQISTQFKAALVENTFTFLSGMLLMANQIIGGILNHYIALCPMFEKGFRKEKQIIKEYMWHNNKPIGKYCKLVVGLGITNFKAKGK